MAEKDTDVALTVAEVMALKPDLQPAAAPENDKPANDKPADAKPSKSYGDGTQFQDVQTTPNGTKGIIYAKPKNGPPLDANGNLIKKTKQQQVEEDRKRGRATQDEIARKKAEIIAIEVAAAAAEKARKDSVNLKDILGAEVGIKWNEQKSNTIKIGRPETPGAGDLTLGGSINIGKSGFSVTAKIRGAPEELGNKVGYGEQGKKAADLKKGADKIDEKYEKSKENIQKEIKDAVLRGDSPSEINRRAAEATTQEILKAGKELGEQMSKGPDGKPWTPPPRGVPE